MRLAAYHLELLQHLPTQRVVRQHAFDGKHQRLLRGALEQLLERLGFQVSNVARMPVIELVAELSARNADLLCIHDHDVVTRIHVGRVLRFVLAAQAPRQLGRKPAKRLAVGIDEVPAAFHSLWLCRKGLHHESPQGIPGSANIKDLPRQSQARGHAAPVTRSRPRPPKGASEAVFERNGRKSVGFLGAGRHVGVIANPI